MPEDSTQHSDQQEEDKQARKEGAQSEVALETAFEEGSPLAYPGSLLGDPRLNERGNQPVRVALMQRMQGTYGNRAVQRFLQRQTQANQAGPELSGLPSRGPVIQSSPPEESSGVHTMPTTFQIAVAIPRADKPDAPGSANYQVGSQLSPSATLSPAHDAPPGMEETPEAAEIPEGPVSGGGPAKEPKEGETVALPDIISPKKAIQITDAVAGSLTYSPTIANTGAAPSGFGVTLFYQPSITGPTVTPSAGKFDVKATVDSSITYQVRGGAGPGGQVSIASDSDPAITKTNYPTVASDLTPDMSDLNGRPPRTKFWARDITLVHELFHANDYSTNGQSGTTLAQNWLNTQTAASAADVSTLLGQVPGKIMTSVKAGMAFPGNENRAYGDGAGSYTARATAVKTKGDASGYP